MSLKEVKVGDKVIEFQFDNTKIEKTAIVEVLKVGQNVITVAHGKYSYTRTYKKKDGKLSSNSNKNFSQYDGYIIPATDENLTKRKYTIDKLSKINIIMKTSLERDFLLKIPDELIEQFLNKVEILQVNQQNKKVIQ